MNKNITISNRLKMVASYVGNQVRFADIGSDHAYVPAYICTFDPEARGIATEINKGPFESAQNMIASQKLSHAIEVRLGDGLGPIELEDALDEVIIAGMGGTLMTSILENGKEKLIHIKKLILQPNIDEAEVRTWLSINGFQITEEAILEDKGHVYEIIVAKPFKHSKEQIHTEKECFFGPILLKNQTELFLRKWKRRFENTNIIIEQLKSSHGNKQKLRQFQKEFEWMEEMLENAQK